MLLKIAIYIFFYISVFLLGFFGITPILVLNSIGDKTPYIILVIIGYPALIGLMVLSYKKGFIIPGFKKRDKGLKVKQLEGKEESMEVKDELEESVNVAVEEDIEALEEVESKIEVVDKEEDRDVNEVYLNVDIEVPEKIKDLEIENT